MNQLHAPTIVTGEFALDAISELAWPKPTSGRHLRVTLEPGGVVLTGTRAKFPDGAEWRFRTRWMSHSLEDDQGSDLASASRLRRGVFAIGSPAGDHELHVERRKIPGYRTREARLMDTAGTDVASIRMSYTKKCDDSDSARRQWLGSFEGSMDIREPVAMPVLLLAVRLTAGIWSRRLPKTGEWTSFPLAKTFGNSGFLLIPYWRRTR
jgi:hypothetical protein